MLPGQRPAGDLLPGRLPACAVSASGQSRLRIASNVTGIRGYPSRSLPDKVSSVLLRRPKAHSAAA